MADSKWIEGLHPDMPVAEAARRVLEIRLQAVVQRLPQALHQSAEDPEHVHQLRVSTRRAGAALRIFRACLPPRAHQKVRKALRRLRRAAGAARDWDVFLMGLEKRLARAPVAQRPGLDFLLGYGQGQRQSAQQQLLDTIQDREPAHGNLLEFTVTRLQALKSLPLRDLALPMLAELTGNLVEAGSRDLAAYEDLHRVRIQGKRLRYAMEIFAGCFEEDFQKRIYPAMEEMQDILGAANDSFVAGQRLSAMRTHLQMTQPRAWKRLAPGIDGLLHLHERRLPQQKRLFERWWRHWHGSRTESSFQKMLRPPNASSLLPTPLTSYPAGDRLQSRSG